MPRKADQTDPKWVSENIISLGEDDDALDNLHTLFGSRHGSIRVGFLVDINPANTHFFVPTNIKAVCAESLVLYGYTRHDVMQEIMPSARLARIELLVEALRSGGYDYNQFDRMDFNVGQVDNRRSASYAGIQFPPEGGMNVEGGESPINEMRPGRKKVPTYSVLVCFHGKESRQAAMQYKQSLDSSMKHQLSNTPSPFAFGERFEIEGTEIKVHDCQNHPLKP